MKRGDIIDHSSVDEMETQKDAWLEERMEWFKDQKFGLFMHWGINSVWGICESWPLSPADEWARPDTITFHITGIQIFRWLTVIPTMIATDLH
jgi:alpha-L-fucosidase